MIRWLRYWVEGRKAPRRFRMSAERGRWEDGSPRPVVKTGPTMLELVKGINPGQQRRTGR